MSKTDGGYAFPFNVPEGNGCGPQTYEGMTLRDWFAGKALQGMMAGNWEALKTASIELHVVTAYRYADAMLAARTKERPGK